MTRIALVAALFSLTVGCGGGDPCAGSPCPNDAKRSASEYQACVDEHNRRRNDKCYQESLNNELCIRQSVVCDSNGRTDLGATFSKAQNACAPAQKAVLCCGSPIFCN